jgi:phosphoglycerate dehydrogenase-like enzyme
MVNILAIQRLGAADRARIEATHPSVRLIDAGGWFDGELRDTWPGYAAARYLGRNANGHGTREERDKLLAQADIVIGGFPFPIDLRARSPRLKWFHQRPAGASNLLVGDLWGSDVAVTTSRGAANSLPIAEYALAGIFYFAKSFNRVAIERDARAFDHRAYRPVLLEGKTALVVGAGGIGGEVGRLCGAVGMQVVGTRRNAVPATDLPPGFRAIGAAAELDRLLPDSDFVIVCCQWTPETTKLFNAARFAAIKPGAVLVNVARGEIIDEDALVEALAQDKLRGVALDVYVGEFERPPDERLWSDPRVVITPHTSSISDDDRHGGIDLFCENLRAYLAGQPLRNVIDWERGY